MHTASTQLDVEPPRAAMHEETRLVGRSYEALEEFANGVQCHPTRVRLVRDQESKLAMEAYVHLVEHVGRCKQCVGGHYSAKK
ncbi:hypothetical protein TNCV_3070851 [Trichonephila clavipes]|nr:hypothetical protein TNCV_3070851 [Trichonephila clavipes]